MLFRSARSISTATPPPPPPPEGATVTNPRHFLSISDLSQSELAALIKRSGDLKAILKSHKKFKFPLNTALTRQTVAMMFNKRSTRTRVSIEGATVYLGGHSMFLGKEDIQLGVRLTLHAPDIDSTNSARTGQ